MPSLLFPLFTTPSMEFIITHVYILALFQHHHVIFLCHLSHLRYLHMENHALIEALAQVGLIPTMDFPSGPRPCHSRLPSPISWVNHTLHLVQGLKAPRPPP
jgi:hypothetical protein